MRIAILGFGSQGSSAFDYWNKPENSITICDVDTKVESPKGIETRLGDDYLNNLDGFDLLIRSPIIHPRDIQSANPKTPNILKKVTTVTNEFLRVCPTRNIVGVTGTKGKGTTSTLIAKMLEASGKKVHLGGNIGTPPLDMLKSDIKAADWVVLELANFQLIDLQTSPHIAVCLMVTPEHLNWHETMEEYIAAKQQLFAHQGKEDFAVYYGLNASSKQVASVGDAHKIPYMLAPGAIVTNGAISIDDQIVCNAVDLKLLGQHNWQNVCAAITAIWPVTQETIAMRSVLTSFSGLEHRLEFVREVNSVKYYDDSFGTTPETAIVAIQAFNQPKVVILGGSDKGASYDELAQAVSAGQVRKVVLIGVTAPKIKAALEKVGYKNFVDGGTTMPQIIARAQAVAQPGDVVLLSTGCASFGLFENYKDRGQQFKQVVQALA